MKKIIFCLLMLALACCSLGALAESPALLTDQGFDYYLAEDAELGLPLGATVVGYHLEEGQTLVYVPQELGGMPVNIVETTNLPASVEVVVVPGNAYFYYPEDGRELRWLYYMDYNEVQNNEYARSLLPGVQPGGYALTNAYRCGTSTGSQWATTWLLNSAEELPAVVQGAEYDHSLLWFRGETDELIYATSAGYSMSQVVDYRLPEGQTYVFFPPELGGYELGAMNFDKLPASVRTVYSALAVADSLVLNGRPEMYAAIYDISEGKKLITVTDVYRVWAEGDAIQKEPSYIPAEDLPQTLNGYTVKAKMFLAGNCVCYPSDYGPDLLMLGAQLPEGANELILSTAARSYPGIFFDGAYLGDDIHVIYIPYGMQGYLSDVPVGREYCMVFYADYAMAMADPALKAQFGHMGESDFVLLESKAVYKAPEDDQGSSDQQETRLMFTAGTLPEAVQGHKLHTTLVEATATADNTEEVKVYSYQAMASGGNAENEKLMNTTFARDGVQYQLNPYTNEATIVGYDLAEGQSELFIPPDYDGYTITAVYLQSVPAQVEKIWRSETCPATFTSELQDPTNRELMAYEYAVEAEDSIMLKSVLAYSWDANGTVTGDFQDIVANTLPEKIAGRNVTVAPQTVTDSRAIYASGGWEYYLYERSDSGLMAEIAKCPEETGKLLILPEELDGYPVINAISIDAVPESVETVIIKGDGSTWGIISSGPVARTITCVNYTDWAGAAELQGGRPAGMQEDDLVWIRAMQRNLATEDQSWNLDQMVNAADMPGEINGRRVVFPEDSMEFYFESGDWRYFRTKNYDNEVVLCLLQYTGPESKTIVIPKALDGYEVSSITTAALPETVEIIVCQSSVFFEPFQNARYGQILSMSYQDYAAYVAIWGKSALPNDANENDLIWAGAFPVTFDGDMVKYERAIAEAIDATTLPKELDGHRVIAPYGFGYYYEEAGWQYCVTQNAQIKGKLYASIIGSNVPEGTTEMAVLQEMGGYEVSGIDIEAVPASVTRLYLSADMTGFSPGFYRENELLEVRYVDWAFMAEHGWLDDVPGMAEDDLAWYNAALYTPEGKRMKADYNVAVNAETLPPEIDGHTMHFPMGIGNFVMSADGWEYTLQPSYDDATTVAYITASTGLEGQETVYIPSQVNGLPVARVELSALPESATTVYMPRHIGGFSTDEKRPGQLLVLEYTDWAGAQSEGALNRVPDMAEDDLALVDARIYEFKGQYNQYKDAQVNPEDLPAELFGKPCWNALREAQLLVTETSE